MDRKTTHGETASGVPITDELVGKLAAKAEEGFELEGTPHRRPGRPSIGSGPATVESVRLDPELRRALSMRAERDHEAASAIIRKALRQYLQVG